MYTFSTVGGGTKFHYHDEATLNRTLCGFKESDYVDIDEPLLEHVKNATNQDMICGTCQELKRLQERQKRYAI